MSQTQEEKNKSTVLEAFETLFNKRDYAKALNFWSPHCSRHSAHIPPRAARPDRRALFEQQAYPVILLRISHSVGDT
jgi:hypothetical protein